MFNVSSIRISVILHHILNIIKTLKSKYFVIFLFDNLKLSRFLLNLFWLNTDSYSKRSMIDNT